MMFYLQNCTNQLTRCEQNLQDVMLLTNRFQSRLQTTEQLADMFKDAVEQSDNQLMQLITKNQELLSQLKQAEEQITKVMSDAANLSYKHIDMSKFALEEAILNFLLFIEDTGYYCEDLCLDDLEPLFLNFNVYDSGVTGEQICTTICSTNIEDFQYFDVKEFPVEGQVFNLLAGLDYSDTIFQI